jgi:hypothetical protein
LSLKRTDLLAWRGFFWAAAKSDWRDGLLGLLTVGEAEVVLALNWEESSVSWEFRRGSCDVIDLRRVSDGRVYA